MRRSLALWALVLVVPPAAAQVGHDPKASPFRDIQRGQWVEFFSGRVFGGGGPLLVGARDGTVMGGRIVLRGNRTLQIGLGGWTAGTERWVVNANDSVATRVSGPIKQRLIAGEATIGFNLTGGKTWHRLAPHFAVNVGLVHGAKSPITDTSHYQFGSKLFVAPALGVRLMLGQHAWLSMDARANFWKLAYPPSYSAEPSKEPGTADHSNAVNTTGKSSQYTLTPALHIGIGIAW